MPDDASTHELTLREREVLRELRQGLSDVQIADRLYISPRTVAMLVGRLLAKTGTADRSQLASRGI